MASLIRIPDIHFGFDRFSVVILFVVLAALVRSARAAEPVGDQIHGGSGIVQGTVTDPVGAVVPNATVVVTNPITGLRASVTTNENGFFLVRQLPFNHYHLAVQAQGFAPLSTDVEIRSAVPLNVSLKLEIATAKTSVTVQGGSEDLIESTPVSHTDISSQIAERLPVANASAALNSIITLATPGVAADSNGMFHPLGEHADTTFSIDNQPVSDQQSRVFSNQISPDAISSMEVITGVPPAEFGDKASLVVRATTKSGMSVTRPTGSVTVSFGSFGTSNASLNLAVGTKKLGNFMAVNGLNSGRFLDTPEFRPLHAKGNSESFFDHLDYQLTDRDLFHVNLSVARSWFQIPNDFDQHAAVQDQRQQFKSFNIAPHYSHQFNANTLLSVSTYVRQDRVTYLPSANPFSDQPATLAQSRRLTNAGMKADLSYTKGPHNAKVGVQFSHTFLRENFRIGLTDPTFNSACLGTDGTPVAMSAIADPADCAGSGLAENPDFQRGLIQFDLTRPGGAPFAFSGRTEIKQLAVYAQDDIKLGNWNLVLGIRGDKYNGLSRENGAQPRIGVAYNIKQTGTVLRASYGRLFLTPYNENLVLSSSTGLGGLASGSFGQHPLTPATRNHFDLGFAQAFGRHFAVTAGYFWKFTRGDYDFDTLFNTPLAFPIQWRKSKIDGASVRVNLANFHGVNAYSAMGHTRSRFFGPEVGGILFNSPVDAVVFRIDHDQAFQQTTHVQYQPSVKLPWIGFNWTYESGLVAGEVPDYATALTFTANQQAQIGLFCGNTFATRTSPIRSCSSPDFGATRVRIPAPGTGDDDKNPPRIAPRHLFDLAVGFDNIFRGDRYKWDLQMSAVNLTNKVALYNFLSTFSGTHFVAPRTLQAQLTLRF